MQTELEIQLKVYGLQVSEQVNISAEKSFKKQAGPNEQVLVTRTVKKINRRSREQERVFVVTNENMYNVSGKTIKRKIPISKLWGITVARVGFEFVLHIPTEYDYRYKSIENRDLIIQYLVAAIKFQRKEPLRCYFVDQEDLEPFTLPEKAVSQEKAFASHPKSQIIQFQLSTFQLDYINHTNSQQFQVLFVRNKQVLRVKLDEYTKSTGLGLGSLGKTYLVTQNKQSKLLVLKTICANTYDIDMDLLEFLLQSHTNEPFLETLELCFTNKQKIYFLFQLYRGGDLYQHLRIQSTFTEQQSKLIFAQIAIALGSLHEKGIIYGDLKPENVLMDEQGYIGLTDFGYGKLGIHRLNKKKVWEMERGRLYFLSIFFLFFSLKGTCSVTPSYCPPEYLKSFELTRMSDWYQLGILLYELLVGIPPFYHPTIPELTLELVLQGQLHLPKNINLSIQCVDMMAKLLTADPSQRIGFKLNFKEIQQHPWLQDLNWLEIKSKRADLQQTQIERVVNQGSLFQHGPTF